MAVRCLALVCLLLAAAAHGQTRFVTDRTVVELRRGPSLEYRILENLEAGAAVEILESDAESGYSRVRVTNGGTEGWILTRFLTAEPIARERLAAAERNLVAARARVNDLEEQVRTLTGELGSTRSELADVRDTSGEVSQELASIRATAANAVQIRDENESLKQRLSQRDREVEELTAENRRLASRSNQNWFLVGGGVLFSGIILGLIAPSLRRKRRSDW